MKMALMCALPYRPKLLILDEPFSGLDPLVRDEFMEGLLDQAGEMTILISSHELGEIDGVATHVAFLDEGKLLFQESMSDLTGRFREVHVTLDDRSDTAGAGSQGMDGNANDGERADVRRHAVRRERPERTDSFTNQRVCEKSTRNRWRCGPSLRPWPGRRATVRA